MYRVRRSIKSTGQREYLGSRKTLEEAIALRDDPRAVAKNGVSGENNPAAKLKNWQWDLVIQEALKGKKSQAQIAREAGISPASLCKKLKAYKNK
jgi:transcriptional regulator with PAS, ATPase and Fis domain